MYWWWGECPYSTKTRDFPRPSRFPSGFALGKSLGSRDISWASGMDFPIPPLFWWSTDTVFLDLLREWNYRAYHTLQNSTKCIAALSHFSQHISEFRTLIPFWIHTSAISHICWHFGNNFWSISEISWLGELQWEDTAPVLWDGDQGNWNLRLIENMFSNCKFSDFWNM